MAAEAAGRSECGAPGPRDQSREPAAFTVGGPGLHRHVNSAVRPRQRGLAWRAARERGAASRAAGPGGPVRLTETAGRAAGGPGCGPASALLAARGRRPGDAHASAPGAPRPAQVRPREAEATSATARALQGRLWEALPGGERVPVCLPLSPGTHAAPALTESEAPSDPAGWLLPRLAPLEHSGAVARTSGRSRLSPTQLGAARRMPKPRRDRPRSRGREQQGRGARGSQPACDWSARLDEHEFLLAGGGVGQGSRRQSQLRALGLERSRSWTRLLGERGGGRGGRRGGGRSRGVGAGAAKNGRRAGAQEKEKQ